jgi:hypothetical protein
MQTSDPWKRMLLFFSIGQLKEEEDNPTVHDTSIDRSGDHVRVEKSELYIYVSMYVCNAMHVSACLVILSASIWGLPNVH